MKNPLTQRRAGVLLHPTSLPGKRDQGDLGQDARRFIDFLQAAGMTVWQMLPLGPTHADRSPYQCLSVHAGNRALISLDDLLAKGWLDAAAAGDRLFDERLKQARAGFERSAIQADKTAYAEFRTTQACWLEDYALYQAIRETQNALSWYRWPASLRDRDPAALERFRAEQAGLIEQVCFEQFLFFMQWSALRDYAHRHGVLLFGDVPIYVAHDSADVWANRELFTLDDAGKLEVVAGVPPDYFPRPGSSGVTRCIAGTGSVNWITAGGWIVSERSWHYLTFFVLIIFGALKSTGKYRPQPGRQWMDAGLKGPERHCLHGCSRISVNCHWWRKILALSRRRSMPCGWDWLFRG